LIFCLVAIRAQAGQTNVAATLIPFDQLTVTNRALVRSVTDHYTLRRQYPARQFKARREEFAFLMDHMEACSVLAQKVGLIAYRATRAPDGRVYADNREGASGFLLQVLAANGKRIYSIEGSHRGLFTARGRGVAVVDFRQKEKDVIEYTGAVFVKVDSAVLAVLAQLFRVFLRGTVDRHFEHIILHPIVLSEKAFAEPQKLLAQIDEMPEADRQLLAPFAALLGASTNSPPGAAEQPRQP